MITIGSTLLIFRGNISKICSDSVVRVAHYCIDASISQGSRNALADIEEILGKIIYTFKLLSRKESWLKCLQKKSILLFVLKSVARGAKNFFNMIRGQK